MINPIDLILLAACVVLAIATLWHIDYLRHPIPSLYKKRESRWHDKDEVDVELDCFITGQGKAYYITIRILHIILNLSIIIGIMAVIYTRNST